MYPSGICIFQDLQISVGSLRKAVEAALLNFSRKLPLASLLHQFQKQWGGGSIYYTQTSQSIQSLGLSLKLLYPNADTLYLQ